VLAFYKALTRDAADLERAKGYLSDGAQQAYDIKPIHSGCPPLQPAWPGRGTTWPGCWSGKSSYEPDIEGERLHSERQVTAVVVGVDKDGNIDYDHPCQVTWRIIGVPNPNAQPYGCEWRLDGYLSSCPAGEKGDKDVDDQSVSQVTP